MNRRRTVVVGVVGSPEALRAVRWAVPEARRRQAVLQLVTALAWTEDPMVGLPALSKAPYGQYLREAAEKGLAAAADVATEVDPDHHRQRAVGDRSANHHDRARRARGHAERDRARHRGCDASTPVVTDDQQLRGL